MLKHKERDKLNKLLQLLTQNPTSDHLLLYSKANLLTPVCGVGKYILLQSPARRMGGLCQRT